jgi:N-acetylmuramoyl-L-alanine amidase
MIDFLRCHTLRARSGLNRLATAASVIMAAVLAAGTSVEAQSPRLRPPDQQTPNKAACEPANFKIALDVGHTPEAPGATSARGVKEHVFNLQLGRRMEQALIQGGFVNTTLVTARGVGRAQLIERTERAKAIGADLLLSIHHDDVQDTYYSRWTYGGSSHAYSDKFSGYSLFVSRDNQHFDESLAFAKLLGKELSARGLRFSTHHAEPLPGESREIIDGDAGIYRYDQLFVLKYSAAPAVLLEAGIIVNRIEELMVSSPERQGQISDAMLVALNAFCASDGRRR